MRHFGTVIAIALSTLLLVSIASGQQDSTTAVPYLIRHSGTLKDAQGAVPFSQKVGGVGVTFAIYKQQDGGAPVWSEIQNVTTDENGQYNVVLGSTATTGIPADLFSQAEERWLGVQVQGQTEQKRVLLVSVPYALKAHEAETLGGLPASAFVRAATADTGGSTPSSLGGPVRTAGELSPAKSATPKSVLGPCNPVPGYITYWDATGALCASKLFQDLTTGNVGIGSFPTPPSEALDVKGVISTYNVYDINEQRILGVSTSSGPAPTKSTNLFVGWLAGGSQNPTPNNGSFNTFTGNGAGGSNNATSPTNGLGNTYNGFGAGALNTIGTDNVMLGRVAGFVNTGSFNTCVGSQACDQDLSGGASSNTSGNAIFGYKAGNQNAPADPAGNTDPAKNTGNSFFGFQAGLSNTTGYHNTFMGYNAGMSNSTADNQSSGRDNTFIGFQSGMSSKISAGNTFVGTHSGVLSGGIAGDCCNTYVGNGSGANAMGSGTGPNPYSSNNTFLGYETGAVTTGTDNTFIGLRSGVANTKSFNNVFLGTITGEFNTLGSRNTFLGGIAGHSNVTGNSNTYLGFNSGSSVARDGSSNILIGSQGVITDSNTIRIGTEGPDDLQQNKVFMAPILLHLGASIDSLVSIDGNGQLGHVAGPTGGGGNVSTSTSSGCPTSPANFITKWTALNTIDCSRIYEDPSTFFVGINNGASPKAELDVNNGGGGGINVTTSTRKAYMIGLVPVLNIFGSNNLFVGAGAGRTTSGGLNTFSGSEAGFHATTGRENTFTGYRAGYGGSQDAKGQQIDNTGIFNAFYGSQSGFSNTTGNQNVFSGYFAGNQNTSGTGNTFGGYLSGHANVLGNDNTFYGSQSGSGNVNGTDNTYLGDESGGSGDGTGNTFVGTRSGIGSSVIVKSTGSYNTILGWNAGANSFTGNSNLYIANAGATTLSEGNTIRIGTTPVGNIQHTDTYIAGIYNSPPGTSPRTVCVAPGGKLWGAAGGCPTSSSRRFKDQILDMGDSSSKLFELRPVTYFYKPEYDDGSHLPQYGLVAEEVAKVYPDLVGYDKDGQPSSVRYQLLAPMLLNELQKQHTVVTAQQEQIQTQAQQIQDLQQRLLRMESLLENK